MIKTSYTNAVKSLFRVFNIILTYWNAVNFRILFIAFHMTIAYCMINRNNASCLVILGYAPKINRLGTSLLGPIELLIALKDI